MASKERYSKSDTGVVSHVREFMKFGMGLSDEMVSDIMKRIRNKGEFAPMKNHMRSLSGSTYKRMNVALDQAEEDALKAKENKGEVKEEKPEIKNGANNEKKEMKEGKQTFMQHLLNEVGTEATSDTGDVTMDVKPEEIRDPEKRREAMVKQRRSKNKSMQIRDTQEQIKKLQMKLKALRGGVDTGEV